MSIFVNVKKSFFIKRLWNSYSISGTLHFLYKYCLPVLIIIATVHISTTYNFFFFNWVLYKTVSEVVPFILQIKPSEKRAH